MLLHNTNLRVGEIAQHFGVRTSVIADIKSGLRWKRVLLNQCEPLPKKLQDLYDEIIKVSAKQKLTRSQVKEIKIIIRDTLLPNTVIARLYNTGATAISNIRTGECWCEVTITDADVLTNELKLHLSNYLPTRKTSTFLELKSIKEIKILLAKGHLRYHQIGEIFDVSESVISNIKNQVYYKEVKVNANEKLSDDTNSKATTFEVKKMRNNCKATIEQVKLIKELLRDTNHSQAEIGIKVGVSRHTVNNIACKKIWNDITIKD